MHALHPNCELHPKCDALRACTPGPWCPAAITPGPPTVGDPLNESAAPRKVAGSGFLGCSNIEGTRVHDEGGLAVHSTRVHRSLAALLGCITVHVSLMLMVSRGVEALRWPTAALTQGLRMCEQRTTTITIQLYYCNMGRSEAPPPHRAATRPRGPHRHQQLALERDHAVQ